MSLKRTSPAGEAQRAENPTKHFPIKSIGATAAFAITGVAGVIIVALGAMNHFGAVGSVGFYASIASGGGVAVIAAAGVISIAIWNCCTKSKEVNRSTEISVEPYSELGDEAINFAREMLAQRTDLQPTQFSTTRRGGAPERLQYQPINQEIALLTTLGIEHYVALTNAVGQNDPNNMVQAANACMKISFALGCLMLEERDEFLNQRENESTYLGALTAKDSYLYQAFFACPIIYHLLRGGMDYRPPSEGHPAQLEFHRGEIAEQHSNLFYQEGTDPYKFRLLYNEYCDRVRMYISDDELKKARDTLPLNWTNKDEEPSDFVSDPDAFPRW